MSIDRRILNCSRQDPPRRAVRFEFQCPMRWDALTPTQDENKRHCATCNQPVFRVVNIADASLRIEQQECIAVPAWMAEQVGQVIRPITIGQGSALTDALAEVVERSVQSEKKPSS